MKRSWFFQNGLFYTLLALVFLVHLILLFLRYHRSLEITQFRREIPLKVKILNDLRTRKQIVQSQDPTEKFPTPDDAYLSDKDRSFERQTRARVIDTFNQGGGGGRVSEGVSLSDLGAFTQGHHPLKAAAREQKKRGSLSEASGQGVSSTNDYIDKVPLGDLTYLNTVEYKYYGFFHRIRQKLEQFWGRSIQEKAEDFMKRGRRIASDEQLVTALIVVLNGQGKITKIHIKGSSGIQELDDAAIDSFNQAGPFPNPPKGLIENGEVKIEWGFVISS